MHSAGGTTNLGRYKYVKKPVRIRFIIAGIEFQFETVSHSLTLWLCALCFVELSCVIGIRMDSLAMSFVVNKWWYYYCFVGDLQLVGSGC